MSLRRLFKENKDNRWVFIKPGGNQGDRMIYLGAEKLADSVGLEYRTVGMYKNSSPPTISGQEIIYVHGGGGWSTWWNWTPRLVKRLSDTYPRNPLIIGPSTVALQDWYIDEWLPPTGSVFYCREYTTYEYLKDKGLQLRLDHDTALHLEKDDEYLSSLLEGEKLKPFKLAAVRVDPESPDTLPESVNLDEYDLVVDPCLRKDWGTLHLYASEILTNRSHSAILGALLGKKTKMFKNKYHKNRSIWEYSLKTRGVEWVE